MFVIVGYGTLDRTDGGAIQHGTIFFCHTPECGLGTGLQNAKAIIMNELVEIVSILASIN